MEQPGALYNLETDLAESKNLILDCSEIKEELKGALHAFNNTQKKK